MKVLTCRGVYDSSSTKCAKKDFPSIMMVTRNRKQSERYETVITSLSLSFIKSYTD